MASINTLSLKDALFYIKLDAKYNTLIKTIHAPKSRHSREGGNPQAPP
jgi:hypothetical protein